MTSSSNQKRNILINLVLPNWQVELTIVISDIKYFLYGTNSLFPYFLGSKFILRFSYIGVFCMPDVEVVEMFIRYWISETSGMWRGTLTMTVAKFASTWDYYYEFERFGDADVLPKNS